LHRHTRVQIEAHPFSSGFALCFLAQELLLWATVLNTARKAF
jgi:hypothetical protein